QGKYKEVTEYAPKLQDAKIASRKDVDRLVGDAYYRIGKFSESVPYLEAYDKAKETTRDEDYQLGYAYYKSGNYSKAVNLFDRVTRKNKDSMAQVAFYHIGECFVKLDNNLSA